MRPPGSVPYPVQASVQLHDAKLVPQCAVPSPIREQHPGASAHPKDRESLQSISGAKYQLISLDLLKPITHCVLHSVGESCSSSCCGARLHFPCTASSFMHDTVEPNSPQCWGGTDAGLSPGTITYRRAASEAESAHPAEM
ncbi:hypothetical protein PBY51_005207 [Eleginops maclovinus]|uniref:Uncharacterized protein n=1 Tax=Eleginops maclovinus TaxID=56733 RepID=A0AAN8AH72_ELEMC|nr:hypothetical protein PBY51_005207 [Eleginops maclovinus]